MTSFEILKNILDDLINNGEVLNAADLSKKIGYDQGNLSKILNGTRKKIPAELRVKLNEKYGIRQEYMASGRGEIRSPDNNYKDINVNSSPLPISGKANLTIVPVKAFGGFLAGYADIEYMETLEHSPWPTIQGPCFAFEVEGFSMYKQKLFDGLVYETGYKPGTFVIATEVEALSHMIKNKDYVLLTTEGPPIIKRFDKIEENKIFLHSINEEYNPIKPIPKRNILSIYLVVDGNIKNPKIA